MTSAPDSEWLIRREMRTRGEATRPQLARACGLSLVTVNRVVSRLCEKGDMEPVGEVSSGGGRPVQLYRVRRSASWAALLRISRAEGGILTCGLELFDPLGARLRQAEARFAHLEESNLDGWLDTHLPHNRRRLQGITLEADGIPLPPNLCRHLSARYHCPCRQASAADALTEKRENTLTLMLSPGAAPLGTLYRHGKRQPCGALERLPLPVDWARLDSCDHTQKEEMVARLLQTLCCTLAPEHVVLYGTIWTERLIIRIRYNLSIKLQGIALPTIQFHLHEPEALHDALRHLALED